MRRTVVKDKEPIEQMLVKLPASLKAELAEKAQKHHTSMTNIIKAFLMVGLKQI